MLEETCDSKLIKLLSRYVLGIEEHGTLKMQDINSIRGLEQMDQDIARTLIRGRMMVKAGVLQEQARQKELGIYAAKYSKFSVGWNQRVVALSTLM